MTKKIIIAIFILTLFLICCRPDFKTKKTSLTQNDIEAIAIVASGDSLKCNWVQLSDIGIKNFVDKWNNSLELIDRIDLENSHPTLGLRVYLKNHYLRNFSTYGQFIQEDGHDFFLDVKDKDFFMKLETAGPSEKIYQNNDKTSH